MYTTFEVAKICGVFHTTAINWINKGKLKAHTTPGGHRRIMINDLIDFMKHFEMPIPVDLISRPKRILVVEDDLSVQRMLVRALESMAGVTIAKSSSGLEALMLIGKEAPDLLVLDMRIPQVNGLDVCRLLRANELTQPIKIIAITGETLDENEESFLKENADAFLRKPLSTERLREIVASLIELETPASPN